MVIHSALVGADLHYPLGHSTAGSLDLIDNTASAYLIQNATGGADYLLIATTNGSERITFGNATDNCDYTWLGSGDWNVGGGVGTSGQFLRSNGSGAAPSWATVSVTDITIADNTGNAFRIWDGADRYLQIDTINGAEQFVFGASANNPQYSFVGELIYIDQINQTSGSSPAFYITAGSHTGRTASTEASDVWWDLSRIVTFATGAIATQRAVRIEAPTYAFEGASTITTAATLQIDAAPTVGNNCTILNNYALRVAAGVAQFVGGATAPGSSGFSEIWGRSASGSGYGTALGYQASATGGTALGSNTTAATGDNISIGCGGSGTSVSGSNSLAIAPGGASTVTHTRALLFGDSLTSTGNDQTMFRTLTMILGEGDLDTSPPANVTIRATNAQTGNTAAGNLTLTAGLSTGSGAGGDLIIQTAAGIASVGVLNTAVERVRVQDTGEITVCGGSNAQSLGFGSVTESHTLAAAATSDTTIQIPANSYVLFAQIRVTTLITGCTTLDVGVAGATTRYGTGLALTSGTTNAGIDTGGPTAYTAATSIRFTAVGGGASFSAGVVRVTVYYAYTNIATS